MRCVCHIESLTLFNEAQTVTGAVRVAVHVNSININEHKQESTEYKGYQQLMNPLYLNGLTKTQSTLPRRIT